MAADTRNVSCVPSSKDAKTSGVAQPSAVKKDVVHDFFGKPAEDEREHDRDGEHLTVFWAIVRMPDAAPCSFECTELIAALVFGEKKMPAPAPMSAIKTASTQQGVVLTTVANPIAPRRR